MENLDRGIKDALLRISQQKEKRENFVLQEKEEKEKYAFALNALLQGQNGPEVIKRLIQYCGVYASQIPQNNYDITKAHILRQFYLDMIRQFADKKLLMEIEKEL